MKISGPNNNGATVGAETPAARPVRRNPAADAGDQVRLSNASSELAAANPEPVIDLARVAEIRQAIAEGRLQINAGAVADRLLASARELIETQRKA